MTPEIEKTIGLHRRKENERRRKHYQKHKAERAEYNRNYYESRRQKGAVQNGKEKAAAS